MHTPGVTSCLTLRVGIDWAETKHDFTAVSPNSEKIAYGDHPHSADGRAMLAHRLPQTSDGMPQAIATAIETPRGPIIDACLRYDFRL